MARITRTGKALHRAWVEEVFAPYLAEADDRDELADLLVVATDVYTWKLLRRDRGLGRDRTERRMRTCGPLLAPLIWPLRSRRHDLKEPAMAEILFVTWDGGGNVPPGARHRRRADGARSHGPLPRPRRASAPRSRRRASRSRRPGTRARSRPSTPTRRSPGLDVRRPWARPRRGRRARRAARRRRRGRLPAVRRDGRAAPAPGRRYVVLEHLYDAYLRGGWLRGPMGWGCGSSGCTRPGRSRPRALRLVSLPAVARPGGSAARRLTRTWGRSCLSAPPRDLADADPTVLVSLSTYRFPRMAECLQADPRRLRRPRRPRRGHHRPGRRPGRPATGRQPRGAPLRAARRADAAGLAGGRPRGPRHDDAGARPRPAAGA